MRITGVFVALIGFSWVVSASTISYDTTDSGFVGTFNGSAASGQTISVVSGSSRATLSYSPITTGAAFDDDFGGVRTDFGFFTLSYSGPNVDIVFPSFSFALNINELSPSVGIETVYGISNAGVVSLGSSDLSLFYIPAPFTLPSSVAPNQAFTIISTSRIGFATERSGMSLVQGYMLGTSTTSTPEPAVPVLIVAGLVSLAALYKMGTLSNHTKVDSNKADSPNN